MFLIKKKTYKVYFANLLHAQKYKPKKKKNILFLNSGYLTLLLQNKLHVFKVVIIFMFLEIHALTVFGHFR